MSFRPISVRTGAVSEFPICTYFVKNPNKV
jgi:hypothetical protein